MNMTSSAWQQLAAALLCCIIFHQEASAQSQQFVPRVTYPVGQTPQEVAVGDFNGDGIPDLVTANSGDGTISILLGSGHGAFMPAKNYPATPLAGAVAVGDFNGDGKLDIVVASFGTGNVGVMLGNGDGTFKPFATIDQANTLAEGDLLVGDFNGDGKLDFIVANYNPDGDPVQGLSVYLGKGDGTFVLKVRYPGSLIAIGLADLNGDGRPDVLETVFPGGFGALLGVGDGTFQPGPPAPNADFLPTGIAAGDFNGDGKQDVAVGFGVIGFGVFLGNGDGTLGAPIVGGTDVINGSVEHSYLLIAGDFNRDGKVDLLMTSNENPSALILFPGNGDGTFGTPTYYGAGVGLAVADLNSDGFLDVAATSSVDNTVSVLLNVGQPVPLALACPAATAQAGVPYSSALTAAGGIPPYTFSVSSGNLPPGLTLNTSSGAVTGTPSAAGAFSFRAKVVDSSGLATGTVTSNCAIDVSLPPVRQELTALLKEVTGVGPGTSLADKVVQAQAYNAVSNTQGACAVLTGLVNEVLAQNGKKISQQLDAKIITDTRTIESAIGCQ
jgi:hypothetical protein